MGISDLQATIDHLERAAIDARAATREAHEAVQAVRRAEREARTAMVDLEAAALKSVDERIAQAVSEGLDEYGKTLAKAAHNGYDHVMGQFTRVSNLAMYGNDQGRGVNIFDELRERALELQQWAGPPGGPPPVPPTPTRRPTIPGIPDLRRRI